MHHAYIFLTLQIILGVNLCAISFTIHDLLIDDNICTSVTILLLFITDIDDFSTRISSIIDIAKILHNIDHVSYIVILVTESSVILIVSLILTSSISFDRITDIGRISDLNVLSNCYINISGHITKTDNFSRITTACSANAIHIILLVQYNLNSSYLANG